MRMLKNPNIRILIANNTWDNARRFLSSIQQYLVRGATLPIYFGPFQSKQWNQDEITIKQRTMILDAPTISTTGLEKEQTSQHYDLIIADDLVARENVHTAEQRQKVKDYINSLMALLEPQGELWVIGTRWHQNDAYADLIEEGIWDVMIRGCYTDDTRTEALFPEKFTLEKLQFLRNKMGAYQFSAWYLNNPVSQDAADFKKEWIKYYEPSTHPSSLYLTIDPAHSLAPGADFTALVVAGMFKDGRVRVVDYVHKRLIPSDLVDAVFGLVKKYRLHRVGLETYAYQKTLKYDMERKMRETKTFFSVDEMGGRRTGKAEPFENKEARIRRLQPLFEQGLVEIRKDMTALEDELLSFPRGKYDDLIDALSYQLDYLFPSSERRTPTDTGMTINKDTGKYQFTTNYWLKNHMPKPGGSLYERFMREG